MKISNWDKFYENAQSRKVHQLRWVPVPNKHDGERYSELMARKDSAEIFSAWILILQVASRSQSRGSLLRDNGKSHSAESLSIKTRGKVEWFKKAIPYLLQIGWLEGVTEEEYNQYQLATSTLPECYQPAGLEGKGREGNRIEEKEEAFELPLSLQRDDFKQKWDEWLLHRKQIRKIMTPLTAKKQLALLEAWGVEKGMKYIELAISNGWTGLFEPKNSFDKPQKITKFRSLPAEEGLSNGN